MVELTNIWNGETLKSVREFLQSKLGGSISDVSTQTLNGEVIITFKKNDGTTVTSKFTAAEGGSDEGYRCDLSLKRRQAVYSAGSTVSFNYTFTQTLYGEEEFTITPNIEFTVWTADSQNAKKDLLYTITSNSIGTHLIEIPASVFDGISGNIIIEGTYIVNYDGLSYTGTKRTMVSIAQCELSFNNSFDLSRHVRGYAEQNGILNEVFIDYKGTYDSELLVYIDGVERAVLPVSSGSTTDVQYSMNTTDNEGNVILSTGKHTMQLVARMNTGVTDDNGDTLYIYSNSLLFDFYKGLTGNHIGIQLSFASSEVITDVDNGIFINTEQYVNSSITYAGCSYTVAEGYADNTAIAIYKNNVIVSNLAVSSTEVRTYTFRDTDSSQYYLLFSTSTNSRKVNIVVNKNSSGVGVASGASIDINMQGRNNSEQPSTIDKILFTDSQGTQYEGTLENFQHRSSENGTIIDGWDGESLVFRGNTLVKIPYRPFYNFSVQNGNYIEFNFIVDTILDSNIPIIDCRVNNYGGFYLKAEEAGIISNIGTKVFTPFKSGVWYTVGFMVKSYNGGAWTNSDGSYEDHTSEITTLLELYVNGVRTGSEVFVSGDSFNSEATISMSGLGAVWRFTGMRVYNRSLRPIDAFNNWLTNLTDSNTITDKSRENAIMNNSNTDVSSSKLISLKKNVMIVEVGDGTNDTASLDSDGIGRLVPTGTPSETQTLTTRAGFLDPKALKKQNYLVKSITYYHEGSLTNPYSFKVGPSLMQCQGTSSTYYSRKNYDLFFTGQKFSKSSTNPSKNNWVSEFDDNVGTGSHYYVDGSKTKPRYKMSASDKGVPVVCLKADYVDSSNLHNTCLARLLNDSWRALGNNFKTPPQYNNDTDYDDVRVSINGHPVDVFVRDADGETYIGQYNMDNEKKDSHDVFGFTAGSGNPSVGEAICVEFLENNKPATLFRASSKEGFNWDTCSSSTSSDGKSIPELEFRYPSNDWVDAPQSDKTLVQNLFEWVYDCYVSWKDSYNSATGEYTSNKFISEVKDHFNVYNLCAWYLYTDYFLAVDQRSKNMMLATWDRTHWYFLPYDCDTALGVTNDGYLILPYDSDENTLNPMDNTQYAFMGHDSALWELVRYYLFDSSFTSNPAFGIEGCNLSEIAGILREENAVNTLFNMTNVKRYFNESRDYWSEMSYNFDEDTKYIAPLTLQSAQGSKTAFAQFVQGARDAHRDWLLDKRFRLLDAKYGCGYYTKDLVNPYLSVKDSSITFSFIVKTYNDTTIRCYKNGLTASNMIASVRCRAGEYTEIVISNQSFGSNDPFVIVGMSSIEELDFNTMAPYLFKGLKLYGDVDLSRLRVLKMEAPNNEGAYSESLSPIIQRLIGVKELTIKGYPNVSGILDLSNNLSLENVNIRCDNLNTIILPYSTINIKSFTVGNLNSQVPWEFWDALNTNYYNRTGGSIVVCEFTVDNPIYGFKVTAKNSNNFIMVDDKYAVTYLNTPTVVPAGRDNLVFGFFGSNNSSNDYRRPEQLKAIYYAKVDSTLFTSTSYAEWTASNIFRGCTSLEYVNTKGWYLGKSPVNIYIYGSNITSLLPPNIKSISLDWVDLSSNLALHNSAMISSSDNTVLEYTKFSEGWFNVVKSNKQVILPTQSTLNSQFFVDLADTIPDITNEDIGSTYKVLNFGSANYNDTVKFPTSVRRIIEGKGWIINI